VLFLFFFARFFLLSILFGIKVHSQSQQTMSTETKATKKPLSRTKIIFDLAHEVTPQELAAFRANAAAAGAKTLTEHFLNLNIRLPKSIAGPAR
jgi:hypothetical protein